MRTIAKRKLALLALATATAAWTHYTWVAPSGPLQANKPVKIMVAHGDRFPQTDEAVNAAQVQLFVIAPSGARTDLKPVSAKTFVAADFTPKENGAYRLAFAQDRGAMSRTPQGVKPGGRDKNPNAVEAFTMLRTGVWHSGKGHKPVGLEVELAAELNGGTWTVQLLRSGKPLAGQPVQVVPNGEEKAVDLGKTGADGKVTYKAAAVHGPAMFLSEFSEKAPAGSPIDARRFSTTLYVNW
jgi:uncharacterized GH25 family protein